MTAVAQPIAAMLGREGDRKSSGTRFLGALVVSRPPARLLCSGVSEPFSGIPVSTPESLTTVWGLLYAKGLDRILGVVIARQF